MAGYNHPSRVPSTIAHTLKSLTSGQALWWGIGFSVVFTILIWLVEPLMPRIDFLPDQGPSWYYWKLPDPTFVTRLAAWGGYSLHQISMWWLIYRGQRDRLKYTAGLHALNVAALGINAFFITFHLVQTRIWFDGLAQDVSIWSSQWSVILLLVLVLHLENKRRGMFFGKKVNWSFVKESGELVRKYHGYVFAWGIIYTFWYHPMVATTGHLLGFFYTLLLMLQGSLMFTRAHLNKWWTVSLEVIVVVHGTLVAVMQGQEIWPMFLFGFLGIFVVTQMHGLGLGARARWGFIGAYLAAVLLFYSQRGWAYLNEIIRVPAIEYLAVFILALLIWLGMRLAVGIKNLHSKSWRLDKTEPA